MICKECKERKFREMIEESKKAMKRYTAKLRKEKHGQSNGISSLYKFKNKAK